MDWGNYRQVIGILVLVLVLVWGFIRSNMRPELSKTTIIVFPGWRVLLRQPLPYHKAANVSEHFEPHTFGLLPGCERPSV